LSVYTFARRNLRGVTKGHEIHRYLSRFVTPISLSQPFGSVTLPVSVSQAYLNGSTYYWGSNFYIWNNPALDLVNAVTVVPTVVGIVGLDPDVIPDILPTINTLENAGPTEQTLAISVPLDADGINGFPLNFNVDIGVKYDVTLPTGANIIMDQSNVTVQSLTIENGANLTANNTLDTRGDLVNHGLINNLGGTVEGNFVNDGTGVGTGALINSTLTIDGSFENTGTVTIVSGGALTSTNAIANSGDIRLNGGSINASAGFTNASQFEWISGTLAYDTINSGTASLLGSNDKSVSGGSVFNNSGTFIQSGSGNLDLDGHEPGYYTNFPSPATLNNLTGGIYSLQSDSGIAAPDQPLSIVNNAGLFQKSAGTGTSVIQIGVTFNNTGTVEVDSGTLEFQAMAPQISGSILTGGTWKVWNNATLSLPGNITENQATVTMSGINSNFPAFNTLAKNQSSFSILNGRGFITAGDLQNSGLLTVGQGSNLKVSGNLSLLDAGSLTLEIGGLQEATDDGTVTVSGSANLGGALVLSFANGFEDQVLGSETFTLIAATDPIIGDFTDVANGARLETADGLGSFIVNYGPSSPYGPNTVVLSQPEGVPEPNTWTLIFVGVAFLSCCSARSRSG
jgi:hypothetical protein